MATVLGTSSDPKTAGVHGIQTGKDGTGVFGESDTGIGVSGKTTGGKQGFSGVFGESVGGAGVSGQSTNSVGVDAKTQNGPAALRAVHAGSGFGVFGQSDTGIGVSGKTTGGTQGFSGVFGESTGGAGVSGQSTNSVGVDAKTQNGPAALRAIHAGNGVGVLGVSANGAGVLGRSDDSAGVFGQGAKDAGVIGFHGDPRLQETTVANNGAQAGVFGASDVGSGIVAYTRNSNVPAIFAVGGIRVAASTNNFAGFFDGNVQVNGDIFVPGADCAEHFDVAEGQEVNPGTVVVIDRDGTLRPSECAYDKKVAGVISGAGAYRPGLILDKQESDNKRHPVALVGKVYCKVDAQYGPVAVGDMLTSSPTPGHAMKADNPLKAFGAVIGKALDDLDSGTGLVRMLVCLQ
jgi:hypothetical protein